MLGAKQNGLKRATIAVLATSFFVLGVMASVLGVAGRDGSGLIVLAAFLSGIPIGLARMAAPFEVTLPTHGRRGDVIVGVGDLFDAPTHLVVAVNEYFDFELGDKVARHSVHGQLIERLFGGDGQRLNNETLASLDSQGLSGEVIPHYSARQRFDVGTTATIRLGSKRIFLPVLTHTDTRTFKATANVEDLWKCLCSLWRSVRTFSNNEEVSIPLIGSGHAQVPLTDQDLLDLILLSIRHESAQKEITTRIRIVLSADSYKRVNLRRLELS